MTNKLIEKLLFRRKAKTEPQRINEENEKRIIALLQSVDFAHSRLPQEVLNHKTSPDLPLPDFEYTAKSTVKNIYGTYRPVNFELSEFDAVVLEIIELFKSAVEKGSVELAKDAKLAVQKCVNEVRCRIPEKSAGESLLLRSIVLYAEEWREYLNLGVVLDRFLNCAQCKDAEQKAWVLKNSDRLKVKIRRGILLLNMMPVGFRAEELDDWTEKTASVRQDREEILSEYREMNDKVNEK